MPSASAKGNYFKLRTKRFFEAKGYQVVFMERLLWIPPKQPGGRMIPVKKDQMGSDLLLVNHEEIIFAQVKLNAANVAAARKEFAKYVFPVFAQRWIVIWTPKAREPEIVDCSDERQQLRMMPA